MNISIDEIVINMDIYGQKCLDTVECVIVDFKDEDSNRYIKLPEFNEVDIIIDYINNRDCRTLKDIKRINNITSIINVFHKKINDLQMYDDWIKHRNKYLCNLAKQWYESNEVHKIQK